MSTQYRLVQSGKTASGGCSAGQGSSEPVASRIKNIYVLSTSGTRSVVWLNAKTLDYDLLHTLFLKMLIVLLKQSRYTPWRRLGGEEV
jgi:carbohydrate-binding DOMON domain-containing protein